MLSILFKKGMLDSAVQFLAITGSRLLLILSLLALSNFVEPEEIVKFDIFIVFSTLFMLFITFGIDSGLAVLAKENNSNTILEYLWSSVFLISIFTIFFYFFSQLVLYFFKDISSYVLSNYNYIYGYAATNSFILIFYSFYRWKNNAFFASMLVLIGNVSGLIFAYLYFFIERTIDSFISGLILGSIVGLFLCVRSISKDYKPSISFFFLVKILL